MTAPTIIRAATLTDLDFIVDANAAMALPKGTTSAY